MTRIETTTVHLAGSPGPRPRRVLIVSGSVGAGHDGAARELADRLRRVGVGARVRDFVAAVPAPASTLLRDTYKGTVSHLPAAFDLIFRRLESDGLIWRAEQRICAMGAPTVRSWVTEFDPDLVVSTYPLASQCLGELRATGALDVPVLTYLTDPAVHRSWLHPGVAAHLTVTAAAARQGAAVYGVPMTTAGPLVPARFASGASPTRLAALRAELRLPAGRPVALLGTGSLGMGEVLPTVADVLATGVTPLVLCGRNHRLRRQVAARPGAVALGWRTDVHELMQLSDVLVQNAGGLSCTEAMVAGLPTLTYRPIPGHGRANAAVLDAAGLAPWVRNPAELRTAMRRLSGRPHVPPALPDPTDVVLAALGSAEERSGLPAAA